MSNYQQTAQPQAPRGLAIVDVQQNAPKTIDNNPVNFVAPVDIAPIKHFRTFVKRTSTTNGVKQSIADYHLVNPFMTNAIVYAIALIPDANFKTKGFVQVLIDQDEIFSCNAADLTDTLSINIPLPIQGKNIDPNKYVDIFIWNNDGATSVNLTSSVSFGVK